MAKLNALKTCLFILLGSSLWAADFRNWRENSGQGGLFFAEGFRGPRQQAMGGTGSSLLTKDPFAVLANPATVDSTTFRHHFAAAGETGGLDQEAGLLAWNFSKDKNLFQATFAFIQNHAIEGLNEQGELTGTNYKPFSQVIQFSTMRNFSSFRFGASLKWIQDHLSDDPGDQDAMGLGLDWGLVWNSPSPRIGFGVSVLNLGRQFRAYTDDGKNDYALNTRVRAGTHLRPSAVRGLVILIDAEIPRYSQPYAQLGLEYQPNAILTLRGGLERPMANILGTLDGLIEGDESETLADPGSAYGNFGFGVRWSKVSLDYALVLMRYEVGQIHKISLRSGF